MNVNHLLINHLNIIIMKISKTILSIACFLLMLPLTILAQEDESFIMNTTAFTIKFGHDSDFTEGVKKWNKCYKDNKGTESWNVWHRLQGKGNVYVLTSTMENWAEMDKSDEAGKACRSIAEDLIIPHIENSEFNTNRFMPNYSRKTNLEGMSIVWVYSFKVNNSLVFNEVVKDVTTTIAQKEGDNRGFWYAVMAGEGANYFVSTPYKSFADLDTDTDNVWQVYESAHGAAKTKAIREKFNAALEDVWSYTYTLETELSMSQN